MRKLFRSIYAKLINRRSEPRSVDLELWSSILRSETPVVVQLSGANWFSQSQISLILEGPDVSLGAREQDPGFQELLQICSEVWPTILNDFDNLDGKFSTEESFYYIRATHPVAFKSAVPPWYERLDEN